MGKSAQGAVWLNAERLSAYDYWQFWRNTEDADVGRFLRLYTELPLAEIARLERLADAEINEAKKVLATEATALAHGRDAAEAAAETAREVFETGAVGGELPQIAVPRDALERGMPAFELFARAGLAASNSEARRLIKGGGARINDKVVSGESNAGLACRSRPAGAHQAQRRPQAPRAGAAGVSSVRGVTPEAPTCRDDATTTMPANIRPGLAPQISGSCASARSCGMRWRSCCAPANLRDPALRDANITVTEVRVSPDLRNATAYVMPLAGANADEVMSGLKRSAPYLKTMIARTVELRQAPNIAFAYDTAFDSAARIAELLHAPEVERDLDPSPGNDEKD